MSHYSEIAVEVCLPKELPSESVDARIFKPG
jgi:hypothetical protein